MNILQKISDKSEWEKFYNYKCEKESADSNYLVDLRNFIDNECYLSVYASIINRTPFSPPTKSLINKTKAGKKRVVYTFSANENLVLKFITYQLKCYDNLFTHNLYSFRSDKTVKSAWNYILTIKNLNQKYVYKVDISSYFNSINPDKLLPILKKALFDDEELYCFLKEILLNPFVIYNDEIIEEKKGILPGAPISSFFANLYLAEMDEHFFNNKIPYLRYSDDIIVFADDEKSLKKYIDTIKLYLKEKELEINPEKEIITQPGEKWDFLGFSYQNGVIDVSDIAVKKLKAKMYRKSRALLRWAEKNKHPYEYAAKAFVKRFNAKLYENPIHNELTWTRWYFPIINTDTSLKIIDEYMQDCIRFLATGKRNKSKYKFTYQSIKALGYRNLVNEFYKYKESNATNK